MGPGSPKPWGEPGPRRRPGPDRRGEGEGFHRAARHRTLPAGGQPRIIDARRLPGLAEARPGREAMGTCRAPGEGGRGAVSWLLEREERSLLRTLSKLEARLADCRIRLEPELT